MYISLPLLNDMVMLPKNQARILANVITSSEPTTNIGYISLERTTPSQEQRIKEDARELVKAGYLKKYPMSKASVAMRTLHISHNRKLVFYMVTPLHQHALNADREGLREIWQLLK